MGFWLGFFFFFFVLCVGHIFGWEVCWLFENTSCLVVKDE